MNKRRPRRYPRRLIFSIASFMAVLLLASGCAMVGPDYAKPKVEVPKAWQDTGDPALVPAEADIRLWWRVFNDPMLNSLIEKAAKGNLDVRAALARVKEARARLGVAAGRELPAFDATGNSGWQRTSEHDLTPGGSTNTRHALGLDASWEIDLFGRIRRSVEAAQADYQASQEDRTDVMITLYAEVARTYISIRSLQARLAAAQKNIESQKQVLSLTRTRFENGLATDLDVAQAESVLASSQAEVPPLKISLNENINTMAVLLGQHPGTFHEKLSQARPIPVLPPKVAVGVPADIMRQRPDIRRAERQVAAATARIGVATADLYPTFSLTGSFGLAATTGGDLLRYDSRFFSFGPSFNWNVFDGGRIRSQIKVQDALTEQALLNYEQTMLNALKEVEDSLFAYAQQRARLEALQQTVKAARRTLRLAIGLYKDGLRDFQSVLDAQRSLFSFDNQLAEATGQVAINLVRLYKSLGGGWRAMERSTPKGRGQKELPAKKI